MPLDLRIDDALNEAWDDFSAYLGRRFTKEISDEKWDWPRDPSPRDIVDTGNLRRSLRITRGLALPPSGVAPMRARNPAMP